MPLDDPLELLARLRVLLLEEEPLAVLVELGRRGDGVGAGSEEAAAGEEKQDARGGNEVLAGAAVASNRLSTWG